MRTFAALSTATVALLAVACSAKPPTYCGDAIAQQSVFVGEQVTIEPCFEDPGGGTLKLAATSSDESVARAFLLRDNVGVGGVSPGEAQVTIEATNDEGQSAKTTFSVLVPNRAPKFVSDMREAEVAVNKSVEWNLAELFEEPDREEMTFAATSSNTGAVGVTVNGSIAEVFALSEGQSQVTLTATDPHESKGTGTVNVTVKTPVTVWEYDFETDDDLDDWEFVDTTAKVWVEDGALNIQSLRDGFFGIAERANDAVTDFTLELTVSNPDLPSQAGLIWITGDTIGDQAYRFIVSPSDFGNNNWVFHKWDGQWTQVSVGNSNVLEFGAFQDWTLSFNDGQLLVIVDDQEAVDLSVDGSTGTFELIWLFGPEEISKYDYAKLSGFLVEDRAAKPRIALSKVDREMALQKLLSQIKR